MEKKLLSLMTKNSENKNAINKIKFSEQSVISEKKVNFVSKKK